MMMLGAIPVAKSLNQNSKMSKYANFSPYMNESFDGLPYSSSAPYI